MLSPGAEKWGGGASPRPPPIDAYVNVAAVDVTRDVIGGSTLVFFWCSVFRVYYHRTKRTFSQRFKDHINLNKPTGVGDNCRTTGHSMSMKNTKVLTRESNWHKRKVKEAIIYQTESPYHEQRL